MWVISFSEANQATNPMVHTDREFLRERVPGAGNDPPVLRIEMLDSGVADPAAGTGQQEGLSRFGHGLFLDHCERNTAPQEHNPKHQVLADRHAQANRLKRNRKF